MTIDLTKYEGHTPGPWRWDFNGESKSLHLVGGRPTYDLTVIDFARWGMERATMRLRVTEHDGMQILYRVHERPDWLAAEPGREHHQHWHQLLTHPDALLSQDAPVLLAEVVKLRADLAEAVQILGAIECAVEMKFPPAEILDENSVLREEMRDVLAKHGGA